MIIGGDKTEVIENIKQAISEGDLNRKVEVNDPKLTAKERSRLVKKYIENKPTIPYRLCNIGARAFTDTGTKILNHRTRIDGLEKLAGISSGAVVTSNHFSPLDNTVVRYAINKAGYKRLYLVSQETNLAMKGWIGFLMNHEDIIPIMNSKKYMSEYFAPMIGAKLQKGEAVLIYPEQEMWFNYRKPRPPKRGAYYYAAKNNVPVISCFVEVRDLKKKDREDFYKVRYTMHILDPIFPDPELSVRENSKAMMEKDYEQKVEAYESAYGKKLTYEFDYDDIAGWIPFN